MNIERIQEAARAKLESLRSDDGATPLVRPDRIVLPQKPFEVPDEREYLFVEIVVAQDDSMPVTDRTMGWYGAINYTVNVPVSTGTAEANNVASRIEAMFSPICSKRSAFATTDGHWIGIRGTRQMPADTAVENLYRINVRVDVEIDDHQGE